MNNYHYKSQWGTDKQLEKLFFPNNEDYKGTFIEIGAWDGVELSNTYYLEKVKDWAGILIEPLQEKCIHMSINRWNKIFNGCIYNKNGYVDFQKINGYSEMVSGIKDGYNLIFKNRINYEIKEHKQTTEIIKIPCLTINSLFDCYNLETIDYLSIDTVTSEIDVLKSYDPLKNPIKVISLDTNNINVDDINQWFTTNGYELYWKSNISHECIYINKNFKFSWE